MCTRHFSTKYSIDEPAFLFVYKAFQYKIQYKYSTLEGNNKKMFVARTLPPRALFSYAGGTLENITMLIVKSLVDEKNKNCVQDTLFVQSQG